MFINFFLLDPQKLIPTKFSKRLQLQKYIPAKFPKFCGQDEPQKSLPLKDKNTVLSKTNTFNVQFFYRNKSLKEII